MPVAIRSSPSSLAAVIDESTLPPIEEVVMHRFTVAQYDRMIELGILTNDDQVELLEGLLIAKKPKNPPHIVVSELLRELLMKLVPRGFCVTSQNPVVTRDSEPEPDAVILRGKHTDYFQRKPRPQDVCLIAEVSDTTLRRDRGLKKRIYARAKIANYWVVNLKDECVEVYSDPAVRSGKPDYKPAKIYQRGSRIPLSLGEVVVAELPINDILPPRG
jgi:Uma2 family endonuclease